MAMKANASSQGGGDFKRFVGVGSFCVEGVNPTKAELEAFLGREVKNDPVYLKEDKDKEGKPFKRLRVCYMLHAKKEFIDGKPNKTNAALPAPFKTTINFFLESRYQYNSDSTKVQVIDKYGRTAWVTIEQAKNRQIPVYSNGPAKLDSDYRPAYRGEEALLSFITNYLNITPIETQNKNTGEWVTNPHPEDCEAGLYEIQNYFKGDFSELKNHCKLMPDNCVKVLVGIQTNEEGNQNQTSYSKITLRNGSKSYTWLKDKIDGEKEYLKDTVFSDDSAGIISDIHEYVENVKETAFSSKADDPFAQANELPQNDDLPFGSPNNDDPFAGID